MKPQLTILLAIALAACSRTPTPDSQAAIQPPSVAVALGVVDSQGGLIRVLAPREGVAGTPLATEGDHVDAGQTLVRLDDRQARLTLAAAAADIADRRAQIEVAAAKARGASRDADRLGRLASADAATRLEAEQAATAAAISAGEQRQALAALQSAQARRDLEAYEVTVRDIRAPAAGRIVRRTAAAGAFVSVGSPLFVLEPDGRRVVRAELDEAFADRVKPGMTAAVSREFQPGVSYRAQILRVSNILAAPALADDMTPKADSRVVTVTLVLPDGTDLRIGQKVLVRFSP